MAEDEHRNLDAARFVSLLSYDFSKFIKVMVHVWKSLTDLVFRRHHNLHLILNLKQIKPWNMIGWVVIFFEKKNPDFYAEHTVSFLYYKPVIHLPSCCGLTPASNWAPHSHSLIYPHWGGGENDKSKTEKTHELR